MTTLLMCCGVLTWGGGALAADQPRKGTIKVTDGTVGQSQEVRLKVVLGYDADLLEYAVLRKPAVAGSLMHMVNPRQAGRVIVVMARARGISLDDEPIMEVTFMLKNLEGQDVPEATEVKIAKVEAMNDNLETIHMTQRNGHVLLGRASETDSQSR